MKHQETPQPSSANVLAWEDPAEHRAFVDGFLRSHSPADVYERSLVEELAEAAWAWRRARAVETSFWEQLGGSRNRGAAGVAEAMIQEKNAVTARLFRYMEAAERRYYKALAAVEKLHRNRGRGSAIPTISEAAPDKGAVTDQPEVAIAAGSPVATSVAPRAAPPAKVNGAAAQPLHASRMEPARSKAS